MRLRRLRLRWQKSKASECADMYCRKLLLTASLFLWPRIAIAQGEPENPPLAQAKRAADRLFQQAESYFRGAEFDRAAETFLAAYEFDRDNVFLCNAGRAYDKAGRAEKARRLYKECLGGTLTPEERSRAEQHLKRIDLEAPAAPPAPALSQPSLLPLALRLRQTETHPGVQPIATRAHSVAHTTVPVYRRWWFWTGLGGAVALVVGGVVAGTWQPAAPPSEPKTDWGIVAIRFAP